MSKFVILASGRGSNASALMDFAAQSGDKIQVVGLISDRAEAGAIVEARKRKVETFLIPHQNEDTLLSTLGRLKPDWACLAGYRRKVSKRFLQSFYDKGKGIYRVLNVHPSLLPAFVGLHSYTQAFRAGVKISGVTVHLVDEGLDTGLVVLQESFERREDDSLKDFEARGLLLEHRLFTRAMSLAAEGRIQIKANPGEQGKFVSISGR